MPRPRKSPVRPKPPAVHAGDWQGEIVGSCSVHLGQSVQPGPPPVSVELSYLIAPLELTAPDRMRWPGVLAIFVPTPMKPVSADAGSLFQHDGSPCLSLSLDVTRPQFSDLVRAIEAKRVGQFRFTITEAKGQAFAVTGWGASIILTG